MLPVVKGPKSNKDTNSYLFGFLFLISLLPYSLGFSGEIYFYSALLLSTYFVYLSFKVFNSADNKEAPYAPKLFKYSIFYLYFIFLLLVVDNLVT